MHNNFNITFPDRQFFICNTIRTKDGSVLNGKIIKTTSSIIIFANSYGVFTIKKKEIKKIYRAKTYQDDIDINIKLGKKMDKGLINKIKYDFIVGEKYKKKHQQKERKKMELSNLWNFHRLSFYFNYTNNIDSSIAEKRNINEIMKHGLSFTLSYDYGFEKYLKKT